MKRVKISHLVLLAGSIFISPLLSGCSLISGESTEFNWVPVLMVVFLLGLAYFLILRPAGKRQKEAQKMLDSVKRGDQVIASGGIYGTVDSVSKDSLVIKVESGDKIRITKQGLMIKRPPK